MDIGISIIIAGVIWFMYCKGLVEDYDKFQQSLDDEEPGE